MTTSATTEDDNNETNKHGENDKDWNKKDNKNKLEEDKNKGNTTSSSIECSTSKALVKPFNSQRLPTEDNGEDMIFGMLKSPAN